MSGPGLQEPNLARWNSISFQLSPGFRSHPKVPGALTSKAGKVPGSSQSLGVLTSKQPALAMCHKTQAYPRSRNPEAWTLSFWSSLDMDRRETTGESREDTQNAFPIKILSRQLHSRTSRNAFNYPNPSFLTMKSVRKFFGPWEKKGLFCPERWFLGGEKKVKLKCTAKNLPFPRS